MGVPRFGCLRALRLEARREDIMLAAESAEQESRVILDAGDERFVVMVYELLRRPARTLRSRSGRWLTRGRWVALR